MWTLKGNSLKTDKLQSSIYHFYTIKLPGILISTDKKLIVHVSFSHILGQANVTLIIYILQNYHFLTICSILILK
jgi:hypothetical protein